MSDLVFTLSAPGHFSTEQMVEIARYARQMAQVLGFSRVQSLIALEDEQVDSVLSRERELEHPLMNPVFYRVFGLSLQGDYELQAVHLRRQCAAAPPDDEDEDEQADVVYIPPQRLVGFHATGGRGCTELRLTFAQYPADVYAADSRLLLGWWAEDTVYLGQAYAYGEEHFVQCYLRHILLFRAIKRRFPMLRVKVSDPTGYWKSSSLDTLLRRARRLFSNDLPRSAQATSKTGGSVIKASPARDVLQELISRN